MRILILVSLVFLLGSVAVADDPRKGLPVFPGDTTIAQIADGQGWSTSLVFVNLQDVTRVVNVFFTSDDGSPLVLNFIGIGRFSSIQLTLPPRGSLRTQTDGASFPVAQGWAEIIAADGDLNPIGGNAIFRFSSFGLPDFEAVVPFGSLFDKQHLLPFDHRNGFHTGIALANPSLLWSMSLSLNFYDQNGVLIISRLLSLQPQNHTAFLLSDIYPELVGRVGILELSISSSLETLVGPILLGLRGNPSGSFTTIFPMQLGGT